MTKASSFIVTISMMAGLLEEPLAWVGKKEDKSKSEKSIVRGVQTNSLPFSALCFHATCDCPDPGGECVLSVGVGCQPQRNSPLHNNPALERPA